MKVLARKTKHMSLFVMDLILGALMVVASLVGLPIVITVYDSSFWTNLEFVGILLVLSLGFAIMGYFAFVKQYFRYRKLPEIQAETDGEYLYIHSTKEAKIPLCAMDGAYIDYDIPHFRSKAFIIHLLSEQYGDVEIEVPEYGSYKLYYVSRAQEVASVIVALAEQKINE